MPHHSTLERAHDFRVSGARTTPVPKSSMTAAWGEDPVGLSTSSNDDGPSYSSQFSPVDLVKDPHSEDSYLAFEPNEHHGRFMSSTSPRLNLSFTRRQQSQERMRQAVSRFYQRNYGVLLVLLAMVFGSGMAISTRLLETPGRHGKAMHPYQILFVRQSITATCSFAYGFWDGTIPDFPLGPRSVRWLLVGRGFSGFLGVFGFYFSLLYLPLSEATVLTFLAPMLTCYVCSYLEPNQSFTRQQQLASFLSLIGVVFIAKPASLFALVSTAGTGDVQVASTNTTMSTVAANSTLSPTDDLIATPQQHLLAIGISMIGVIGATGAYTFIRKIGERAHPFISINYFAVWCTIVSLFFLAVLPDVSFRLPGNAIEWGLLLAIGFFGFVMQYLMTAGLAYGGAKVEESHKDSGSLDQMDSGHSAGGLDERPEPHNATVPTHTLYSSNLTPPTPPESSQGGLDPTQTHHLTPYTPSYAQSDSTLRQRSPSPNKSLLPIHTRPALSSPDPHTTPRKPLPPPPSHTSPKSSGTTQQTRATSMVYTQMLFALAGDKLVFGITPTAASWIGSVLILASAVWVASATDGVREEKEKTTKGGAGGEEEEAEGLLSGAGDADMVELERFDGEGRQQTKGADALLARQLSYTSV